MKRCSGTALLVFVVAVSAYALADNLPQPQATLTTPYFDALPASKHPMLYEVVRAANDAG